MSEHEINKPVELRFFARLFKGLKSKPKVRKDQLGVYHYTLSIYADTKALHNVKYDIFVKVQVSLFCYNRPKPNLLQSTKLYSSSYCD